MLKIDRQAFMALALGMNLGACFSSSAPAGTSPAMMEKGGQPAGDPTTQGGMTPTTEAGMTREGGMAPTGEGMVAHARSA